MLKHTPTSLLGKCRLSVSRTENGKTAYTLMGYPLLLSDREGEILSMVLCAHPTSIRACELAEAFGSSEGQISVQIHRINAKAKPISGRKLIIGISHHGFSINSHM